MAGNPCTHVRPVEMPLRDDPGGLEHVSPGAERDALARLAVVQKRKNTNWKERISNDIKSTPTFLSQSHMGKGGEGGGFPPSEGQKPTPYPKAENWLPSKKIFDSPPQPSEAKNRAFLTKFY